MWCSLRSDHHKKGRSLLVFQNINTHLHPNYPPGFCNSHKQQYFICFFLCQKGWKTLDIRSGRPDLEHLEPRVTGTNQNFITWMSIIQKINDRLILLMIIFFIFGTRATCTNVRWFLISRDMKCTRYRQIYDIWWKLFIPITLSTMDTYFENGISYD